MPLFTSQTGRDIKDVANKRSYGLSVCKYRTFQAVFDVVFLCNKPES